ncbi:Sel1 repeat protein [compost metagenome]
MARNMLGRCHEHGWGCEADVTSAARHYRKAAVGGLDWGLYNYANLLATGRGVIEDHTQALACYLRAAHLGHAKSMNLLGRYLEEGRYCPADPKGALEWYRRSAEGGDFRGQFSYGACLFEQGQPDQALVWLHRAMTGGNAKFLRKAAQTLRHVGLLALAETYLEQARALAS